MLSVNHRVYSLIFFSKVNHRNRNADQNRFDQARCPLIIVNIFPLIIRISDDIIGIHRIFQFLERDVHRARVHGNMFKIGVLHEITTTVFSKVNYTRFL